MIYLSDSSSIISSLISFFVDEVIKATPIPTMRQQKIIQNIVYSLLGVNYIPKMGIYQGEIDLMNFLYSSGNSVSNSDFPNIPLNSARIRQNKSKNGKTNIANILLKVVFFIGSFYISL